MKDKSNQDYNRYKCLYALTNAIPDALPRRFVSLKPIVTAKHNIIKIQLISGM